MSGGLAYQRPFVATTASQQIIWVALAITHLMLYYEPMCRSHGNGWLQCQSIAPRRVLTWYNCMQLMRAYTAAACRSPSLKWSLVKASPAAVLTTCCHCCTRNWHCDAATASQPALERLLMPGWYIIVQEAHMTLYQYLEYRTVHQGWPK